MSHRPTAPVAPTTAKAQLAATISSSGRTSPTGKLRSFKDTSPAATPVPVVPAALQGAPGAPCEGRPADEETPAADPALIRRVTVEKATLDPGSAVLYKQYGDLLRIAYDPNEQPLSVAIVLVGQQLGEHVEQLLRQTAYVPPTEYEDRVRVVCAGEHGAILNAYLYTPEWQGKPDGPTRMTVFTEPSSEGELDAAGATQLIVDLEQLLPKLRAMRDVLAAHENGAPPPADRPAGLADAAVDLAVKAVTASLAGLQTNPRDVAQRLHRAIDNAQGWHLAEVGGHSEVTAYADSRHATATDAMADALKASEHPGRMANALRNALDLVISEAGQ